MTGSTCPKCGNTIAAEDPHGLCPACLLKRALDSVDLRCARCGRALEDDARFCAGCGAAALPQESTAEGDPLRHALEAKLGGQYRLIRLLGHGGMGAVYLARDLTLDREVAIKVVKTSSDAQSMYDRFRREARTAAKLSHPNVVPLHAFGEVEGMPYFVMGYVRGESLADRLRRDGKLPEEEGRRILAEIAGALDHAHRQGVVHRDVKPDNVLIEDESGRALLTDFGVARAIGFVETMTRSGSVVGTPHYMSPEQASGRADIDARSDIYSLGVMGYAVLAGRLPFDGQTAQEVLTKHLTQEPPPLRSLAASLSDSTVQALERCLAKDPAARWQDARSLKLALGVAEESQLPDALQSVEGRGVIGLAAAAAWLIFVAFLVRGGAPPAVFLLHVGIIAFLYGFVLVNLRREGFSLRQSQTALWREPAWWLWWYPRGSRRPRNVWDRLPAPVRQARWCLPIFIVFFAGIFVIGEFPNLFRSPRSFMVKLGGLFAWMVIWNVVTVRAGRLLKRMGLAPGDARRVMISVPPSRASFWSKPHIAAVLEPATKPDHRRSDLPHDHLQTILRHADELSGPLRPLGAQAGVAARQLVASIEDEERRIAELARNLEPGEEERLREKIDALAPSASGDDEYAPMRSLLEKQLELIRGLSSRIEVAKEKRNRRVEMLRTLALHVMSLHARMTEAPSGLRPISDDVRALCDAIERQARAHDPLGAPGGGDQMPTIERT